MDWLVCKAQNGTELKIGCDIYVQYDHEVTINHAKYHVESGFDANDHSIVEPDKLTVTLVQSKTPLSSLTEGSEKTLDVHVSDFKPGGLLFLVTTVSNAVSSIFSAPKDPSKIKVWTYDTKPSKDFVNEFHQALLTSAKGFHECTISLKNAVYTSMKISSVKRSYGADRDGAESFTVSFDEFRVTSTALTQLPRIVKPKTSKGKAGKKELSDAEKDAARKSLLARGLDSIAVKLFP